jgi:hypothetical protein
MAESRGSKPPLIVILTGNHLCHNPRAIKEATILASAGYQVRILGGWLDKNLKELDEQLIKTLNINFEPVIDWTTKDLRASFQKLLCSARFRLGGLLHSLTGREISWELGYAAPELTNEAKRCNADLSIAHSEQALWVVSKLSDKGARVGVDMEDWFSEDLMPETRRTRPVKLLRGFERAALCNASYKTCTSQAMAEELVHAYGCQKPAVIYNAFPWRDRAKLDGQIKDRKDRTRPSIHWYSQTLGFGRGLEDLVAALPSINFDVEVHLRGNPASGFPEWLNSNLSAGWRKRIFIHSLVSNDELLSRIAEHDIGFAGEQKYCRSRDLTVTNKILHYLLAGIAVLASDTAGQDEVALQAPGAVRQYRAGDPSHLAAQLNALLGSQEELVDAKRAALTAAQETFCWEKQAPKLVTTVENALRA